MVKGGRVSPLKGTLAGILNLKPIVSIDDEGASKFFGQALSKRKNRLRVLELAREFVGKEELGYYAIVHAAVLAEVAGFASRIEAVIGRKALVIQRISPIIALNAGKGRWPSR